MATRNIVPRATGEGSIGTSAKTWGAGYFDDLTVTGQGSLSDYLPLAGGTMTGNIVLSPSVSVKPSDTSSENCFGNDYEVGGRLVVFGKNNANAGWFSLQASDGVNTKPLVGKPSGTLTWAGNNVITQGTHIQTGKTSATTVNANGNATVSITFSPAFSSTPVVVATVNTGYAGVFAAVGGLSASGATIYITNVSSTSRSVIVGWMATSI